MLHQGIVEVDQRFQLPGPTDVLLVRPLVLRDRAAVHSPEGLQPALAVDADVVVPAPAEKAADPRDRTEGIDPLGPRAALGMVDVEAVGQNDDAFVGQLDLHVRF